MRNDHVDKLHPLKFNPGETTQNQIHRARLCDQIIAPSPAKAVYLYAPAGFGKTIAMSQAFHLFRRQGGHAAWLSCDITDCEPETFIENLVLALQVSGLPIKNKSDNLTDLLRIFDQHQGAVKIFIDEYESVCGTFADEILNRLILLLPAHVQLIIGTRKVPEKYHSRREVEGIVETIEARMLRFTDAEAEALLGQNFSRTELNTVIDFAEGWPLVLQLANLKHRHCDGDRQIIETLKTPTSEAFSYLAEQVFDTLLPEQQDFLKRCSILTHITADTANALTGRDDAFAILSGLMGLQPIVTVADSEPLTVKIHPMFREYLLQLLQHQGEQHLRSLHRKAALHYMEEGSVAKAIVQTRLARDPELIATIIEMSGGIRFIVNQGAPATSSLLGMVPQPLVDKSATLCLVQVLLKVIAGNGRMAEEQYKKLLPAQILDRQPPAEHTELEQLRHIAEIYLALTLDLSHSIAGYMSQEFDLIETDIRLKIGADPRILCLLCAAKFFLLQRYGDTEQARRSLVEYETLSETHGYARNLTAISPHLALLAYNVGDFDTAIHHFSDALTHRWDRFNQREKLMSQTGNGVLARIHYERNELDLALANIEAIGSAPDVTFIEIAEAQTITLARCWAGQGKLEHALNHLRESARQAEINGLQHLAAMIYAAQVSLLLRMGNAEEADKIVARAHLAEVWESEMRPNRSLWLSLEHLLRALVPWFLQNNRLSEAERIAAEFCEKAAAQGRCYLLSIGLVFRAKAVICGGHEEMALSILGQAVSETAKLAITRPYTDAGPDIILLLEKVISSLASEKEITHAQHIIDVWSNQHKQPKVANILTTREQEVLAELAKGHPTKVIARDLNLSPETIKHHLKHIYAKLGVGNRKEAVTEAWRKAMFS